MTFDPSAQAEAARNLGAAIASGFTDARHAADRRQAKVVRDNARCLLAEHVADVRIGGRYAYRGDPEMARKFTSSYAGRRRGWLAGPDEAPAKPPGSGQE